MLFGKAIAEGLEDKEWKKYKDYKNLNVTDLDKKGIVQMGAFMESAV